MNMFLQHFFKFLAGFLAIIIVSLLLLVFVG